MYIDGHEWDDVIKYQGTFIQQWEEYEKRMVTYNPLFMLMTIEKIAGVIRVTRTYLNKRGMDLHS
jgi:hypothetical protein